MCSNYRPTRGERLREFFNVAPPSLDLQSEVYPASLAPIIRLSSAEHERDTLECVAACFGLVPHWADRKLARRTYNARTETVAAKPSYRHAFRERQYCVIPLDAFYEPNYETGKAVRWRIAPVDDRPLGVAGIWEIKQNEPNELPLISFSMLTINADKHKLMRRFHGAEDEKRMLVILDPADYQPWLHSNPQTAAAFYQPYPAELLVAEPAPRKPVADVAHD
ncbi:MAG: SOS response-associated peptidase [Sulfuricaulis sp.]